MCLVERVKNFKDNMQPPFMQGQISLIAKVDEANPGNVSLCQAWIIKHI